MSERRQFENEDFARFNKDHDDRKEMFHKWISLSARTHQSAFVFWNNSTVKQVLRMNRSSCAEEESVRTLPGTFETSSCIGEISCLSSTVMVTRLLSTFTVNHRKWDPSKRTERKSINLSSSSALESDKKSGRWCRTDWILHWSLNQLARFSSLSETVTQCVFSLYDVFDRFDAHVWVSVPHNLAADIVLMTEHMKEECFGINDRSQADARIKWWMIDFDWINECVSHRECLFHVVRRRGRHSRSVVASGWSDAVDVDPHQNQGKVYRQLDHFFASIVEETCETRSERTDQ